MASLSLVTAMNSPREECCLILSTIIRGLSFYFFYFLLAGSYTLDYRCDGLEIESLNINNAARAAGALFYTSAASWCLFF